MLLVFVYQGLPACCACTTPYYWWSDKSCCAAPSAAATPTRQVVVRQVHCSNWKRGGHLPIGSSSTTSCCYQRLNKLPIFCCCAALVPVKAIIVKVTQLELAPNKVLRFPLTYHSPSFRTEKKLFCYLLLLNYFFLLWHFLPCQELSSPPSLIHHHVGRVTTRHTPPWTPPGGKFGT